MYNKLRSTIELLDGDKRTEALIARVWLLFRLVNVLAVIAYSTVLHNILLFYVGCRLKQSFLLFR